jgi:glycosyltransferase involved in cell wall biosynthesis
LQLIKNLSKVIRTPLISVLLPVFNCEKYVFEAVQSVLNQTYSHFEFLIIDDCSTDDTLKICKSFQDERIVIIEKEKNSGYTNSLNYGISIAKGKYIARMDGDDISLPERFVKQVAFMEMNSDVIVCGTNFSFIDTDELCILPMLNEEIKTKLLFGNCIGHPTVMLRKSVFFKNNILYDTQMEPAEDFALWVQLISFGKLYNLQECLLKYRIHDDQVSHVRNERQKESAKQTRLKLLTYLNVVISSEQQKVYLKAIDNNKKLNFEEFMIFLDLKKMIINANENYFNKVDFRKYWTKLENKFNSYYFKNRTSYSLLILKNYLSISSKIDSRLTTVELLKLTVKSIINHKVK